MSGDYTPRSGDQPNSETVIEVTQEDLPLHCPLDRMRLWDSHPRVFLPIQETGKEQCPYCGTIFKLVK